MNYITFHFINEKKGHLGGSAVEHLPSAQSVIPGPGIEEPASPSVYVSASLSLSLMNEYIKSFFF